MPRRAPYLLRWSPDAGAYMLVRDGAMAYPSPVTDGAWSAWLDGVASFAFQSRSGAHCTVRKEAIRGRGAYWYAYRFRQGRTVKQYIGRAEDLSIGRLEQIAERLADACPAAVAEAPRPVAVYLVRETPGPPAPRAATLPVAVTMPLLTSKLHPPRLPAALVARAHLLDRLYAYRSHKLTVLSAPAGFGKTTIVCQWIAERGAHPSSASVAWLSLDAADNDPVRFWRYVIMACRMMDAEVGQEALTQLASALQPPYEPPPLEVILASFLNDIMRRLRDGLLILDDYHAITAPRIHESLAFFIDHLPPTMHVVLVARTEPPLPLLRWRARGELQELHAADLRFSLEETTTFLRQTLASLPSEKAIARLDARLEGWAAGLRLVTLAAQGSLSRAEVERHLTILDDGPDPRPHRPILDYVISEVLLAQPEVLQLFLLQTSVLGRLSGPLCDAVTGRAGSAALLEHVARAGLFLESLDQDGQWYRYHALFAEAMRAVARVRLGDGALRALSLRASVWYEQHDLLVEAVDAALRAQDAERAAVLIERLGATGTFYEPHTICKWLEQVPDAVRRAHPAICLSHAVSLLLTLFPDSPTPAVLARIEEALQLADAGWRRSGDPARLGEVYAVRAMIALRQGHVTEAASHARQALAALPPEDPGHTGGREVRIWSGWRNVGAVALGTEALREGRYEEARALFLEAQRRSGAANNRPFTRIATLMLGVTCAAAADLHQADAYLRQVLPDAREQGDTEDVAWALCNLAALSYEWNDLDAAEQQVREACAVAEHCRDPDVAAYAWLSQALLPHARGETAAAAQHLSGLVVRLGSLATPRAASVIPEALIWQGRLYCAAGDLLAARRSLSALAQLGDVSPVQREMEQILAARLLLAEGRVEDATCRLDQLLSAARERGHRRQALEIELLLALAHAACKRMHEARQHLRQALSQGCGEGFLRLFLDEGEPLAALLRSLLPSLRERALRAYTQRILRAFAPPADMPAPMHDGAPLEPLSVQERRVLRLLAAGRSNPEIARELVVSVNTIKGHVRSIYRKLDVRNRLEASAAAGRLPP